MNNTEIFYEDAVMCKVTEMYIDTNDNLQLTVYASNGTDKAVKLTGVDITVADGDQKLFEKHFDINFDIAVEKDGKTLYTLTLYSPQDINFTTWNRPKITDFSFSYENQ